MNVENIDDLMIALGHMFPKDFEQPGQLAELSKHYRAALGKVAPKELNSAWLATVASWTKSRRPYPADIAALLPGGPKPKGAFLQPKAGPPYYTPERVLWDKTRKEVRDLPVAWGPGDLERAKELGYFEALAHEAWPESKYFKSRK